MMWKPALIRAIRTLLQGALATLTAFFLAVKGDGTFLNIQAHGAVLAFGFFLTGCWTVISFLQNLLEDNTAVGRKVPKG